MLERDPVSRREAGSWNAFSVHSHDDAGFIVLHRFLGMCTSNFQPVVFRVCARVTKIAASLVCPEVVLAVLTSGISDKT